MSWESDPNSPNVSFVVDHSCCCCAVLNVGVALLTTLIATQGVADHKQLSDSQSKRSRPAPAAVACPEPEILLAAFVPVNSCTSSRLHRRIKPTTTGRPPVRKAWPRPAVLSSTVVRSHQDLKSMTEELGSSELPTSGSASLLEESTAGFNSPATFAWPAHTQNCRHRGFGH